MKKSECASPRCPICANHIVATMLLWTNQFHFRCLSCGHNWTGPGLGHTTA